MMKLQFLSISKGKRVAMLIILSLLCVAAFANLLILKSCNTTDVTPKMVENSKALDNFRNDIKSNEVAIDSATNKTKNKKKTKKKKIKVAGAPIDREVAIIED